MILKRPACGNSNASGRPARKYATSGKPTISASATRNTGACCPVRSCRLRAQIEKPTAPATPASKAISTAPKPCLENRLRQKQAAIVEIETAAKDHAVADIRQRLEHRIVPEQQLQQQRQIADAFDIAGRNFRDQPVARQARYADDKADDGRENDADPGYKQRVKQPNPEGAPVGGAARGIFDQRLADIEAGGVLPEPEAGCDVCARQDFQWRCWPRHKPDRRRPRKERADRQCCGPWGRCKKRPSQGAPRPEAHSTFSPRRACGAETSSRRIAAGLDARGFLRFTASGSAARTGCRLCSTICSSRARS